MYESYVGQKLSINEIFNKFTGMAVIGEPDPSNYPTVYITIDYIGTPEEARAKLTREGRKGRSIALGRPARKGEGVVWDSKVKLDDLVGIWDTSVTADGAMRNERMVLKSDGKGIFVEANMGPKWGTLIDWYVEQDVLYINSECNNICAHKIEYASDEIVPCMSGKERHFTRLSKGAHCLKYYRAISKKTLEELEKEANENYDELLGDGAGGCVMII